MVVNLARCKTATAVTLFGGIIAIDSDRVYPEYLFAFHRVSQEPFRMFLQADCQRQEPLDGTDT